MRAALASKTGSDTFCRILPTIIASLEVASSARGRIIALKKA